MAKDSNDKNSFKHTKSGSSNSKIDFIKSGTDFLDEEILNSIETDELSVEDLADPELSDLDEDLDQDDDTMTIEEEISEEVKEPKTGKVTVISRKVSVKKPVAITGNENVEKDVNKLVKDLIKDVSASEAKSLLQVSKSQKEQMISGGMDFLARDKVTSEDKREFLTKLDEITSSEEVSNANASFVLKWLKHRK